MHVLFLSKYALNSNYGQPTRQYFYCKYLSRQNKTKVWLVSSRSTITTKIPSFPGLSLDESFGDLTNVILNGPLTSIGFSFKRIWSWIWFEIQILRLLPRIRKFSPDIVVVSSLSIMTFLTGVILKWVLRIPLVVEVRDVYPATLVEVGGVSRWNPFVWLLSYVERIGYEHSDQIVSSLPNLESHVAKILGKSKPVLYLPMGFDPEYENSCKLTEQGRIAMETLSSLSSKFIIGYAGTIGNANALLHSLEAVAKLSKSTPEIVLVLLGDGPLLEDYRRRFSNVNTIFFLGRFPKSDLHSLLQKMHIVINPWKDLPIYRFGISPNKWIDYMQAARPILAPFGGFQHILHEVDCGWFIPPEDSTLLAETLARVSKIPRHELNRMGQNGRSYMVANLSYAVLSKKLYDALAQLVAEASAKRKSS